MGFDISRWIRMPVPRRHGCCRPGHVESVGYARPPFPRKPDAREGRVGHELTCQPPVAPCPSEIVTMAPFPLAARGPQPHDRRPTLVVGVMCHADYGVYVGRRLHSLYGKRSAISALICHLRSSLQLGASDRCFPFPARREQKNRQKAVFFGSRDVQRSHQCGAQEGTRTPTTCVATTSR